MSIQTKVIDGGAGVGKYNLVVYTPDGATGLLPAFVFIPGKGEFGTDASRLYINGPLRFIKSGWKPNFIVVGAQEPQMWPPGRLDPPYFMRAVLKELLSGSYGIDPNQFYLTGLSDGAAIIYNYMQAETDALYRQPAAIIPMSMGIIGLAGDSKAGTDALGGNDARFAKVPFIGYCGANDTGGFREGMQRYVGQLQVAGYANASVTVSAGGHDGNYWAMIYNPNGSFKTYDKALDFKVSSAPPVVTPPPVTVPVPKTLKSVQVIYTYSDGTTETITRQ